MPFTRTTAAGKVFLKDWFFQSGHIPDSPLFFCGVMENELFAPILQRSHPQASVSVGMLVRPRPTPGPHCVLFFATSFLLPVLITAPSGDPLCPDSWVSLSFQEGFTPFSRTSLMFLFHSESSVPFLPLGLASSRASTIPRRSLSGWLSCFLSVLVHLSSFLLLARLLGVSPAFSPSEKFS